MICSGWAPRSAALWPRPKRADGTWYAPKVNPTCSGGGPEGGGACGSVPGGGGAGGMGFGSGGGVVVSGPGAGGTGGIKESGPPGAESLGGNRESTGASGVSADTSCSPPPHAAKESDSSRPIAPMKRPPPRATQGEPVICTLCWIGSWAKAHSATTAWGRANACAPDRGLGIWCKVCHLQPDCQGSGVVSSACW